MDEDVDRPSELTLFDDDQAAAAVPLLSPADADRLRELQQLSPDERLQGLLNAQQLRAQLKKGLAARYTPRERAAGAVQLKQSFAWLATTMLSTADRAARSSITLRRQR